MFSREHLYYLLFFLLTFQLKAQLKEVKGIGTCKIRQEITTEEAIDRARKESVQDAVRKGGKYNVTKIIHSYGYQSNSKHEDVWGDMSVDIISNDIRLIREKVYQANGVMYCEAVYEIDPNETQKLVEKVFDKLHEKKFFQDYQKLEHLSKLRKKLGELSNAQYMLYDNEIQSILTSVNPNISDYRIKSENIEYFDNRAEAIREYIKEIIHKFDILLSKGSFKSYYEVGEPIQTIFNEEDYGLEIPITYWARYDPTIEKSFQTLGESNVLDKGNIEFYNQKMRELYNKKYSYHRLWRFKDNNMHYIEFSRSIKFTFRMVNIKRAR